MNFDFDSLHNVRKLTLLFFSIYELKIALDEMPNGKSLGSDGISVDFYKLFWPFIGNIVTNVLIFSHDYNCLSEEQRRSVVTLFPKPGKDINFVKKIIVLYHC